MKNCPLRPGHRVFAVFALTAAMVMAAAGTVTALVSTLVVPAGASQVPGGITVDAEGNLYSADFGGTVAYRVTPGGEVSVFARDLLTPSGNAFDSRGRYYQSNYQDPASPNAPDSIVRIDRRGRASIFASNLVGPVGIAIDSADTLFVAMCNTNQIWRIGQDRLISIFARSTSFQCPNGITFDDRGDLYVVSFNSGVVVRVQPDGTAEDVAMIPGGGNGHVVHVAGSLYVTDRVGHRVYEVELPRRPGRPAKVRPLAGTGVAGQSDGPNDTAAMRAPNGIARSATGDRLFTNEFGGAIRVIELGLPRPAKPNRLRVAEVTDRSVELTWNDRDRREEEFLVQVIEGRRGEPQNIVRLPWNSTSATIDGLNAGTLYTLRVVAANGTTESRPSKRVRVTTRGGT